VRTEKPRVRCSPTPRKWGKKRGGSKLRVKILQKTGEGRGGKDQSGSLLKNEKGEGERKADRLPSAPARRKEKPDSFKTSREWFQRQGSPINSSAPGWESESGGYVH